LDSCLWEALSVGEATQLGCICFGEIACLILNCFLLISTNIGRMIYTSGQEVDGS
jgi:hypothetical protein